MSSVSRHRAVTRLTVGLVVGASLSLVLATAGAQKADSKAAREAYDEGTEAFAAGDYSAAAERFENANSIMPSPNALYWIAQSYDKKGNRTEALSAYEDLLADPNVNKIGLKKKEIATTRLAALKQEESTSQAAASAPPEEPVEESAEEPPDGNAAPEDHPLPPAPEDTKKDELLPKDRLYELGLFLGPLFISRAHNLHEDRYERHAYERPAWLLGLRAAYFASRFGGLEVEYAHGWGSVTSPPAESLANASGKNAQFNTVRGHIIAQIPSWRFVPFALLGAGILQATSDRMGTDADVLVELGIGAKLALGKIFSPRLDFRLDMTQREAGGFFDGVSFHPEILLGVTMTLGR